MTVNVNSKPKPLTKLKRVFVLSEFIVRYAYNRGLRIACVPSDYNQQCKALAKMLFKKMRPNIAADYQIKKIENDHRNLTYKIELYKKQ